MNEQELRVLIDTVKEHCEEKKYQTVRKMLIEENPADIALVFLELEEKDLPLVFRMLPKELASEAFVYMDSDCQELLIKSFSDRELKEVINEIYLDDTVDIIEEMPANVVARILAASSAANRKQINELLKYSEDTAGSIMTPEYVSLKKEFTVSEAFERIRKEGVNKETIYICYVTVARRLVGTVSVKDLLLSPLDEKIEDIMETNVISIDVKEDKEEVSRLFSKYDLTALPVVDSEQRIVGIVTVDDALDVMEEEATEDIEVMAAITPGDRPYIKTGVFSVFLQRFPWLLLLMVSATFTGAIITGFEAKLAAFPALIAYIPMLMGTGGNAGGQSSATVVRGLAVGEIETSDIFRLIWKECRVSVLCGVALAVANFIKIYLVDILILKSSINVLSAAVVCITLAITVVFAKIVGCVLPVFAKKIGFDPAVMASPFITTFVDTVSLVVYMLVATAVLY